jgi:hypothetical protein
LKRSAAAKNGMGISFKEKRFRKAGSTDCVTGNVVFWVKFFVIFHVEVLRAVSALRMDIVDIGQ